MIKKLKKRFIIIAMIAVSAVLLLLCVTVNAVNFVSVNSQLTDTLEKISDNRGRMPTAEPEPIPEEKDGQPSPPNEDKPVNRGDKEAPFMTRYFVLEYDENGTLTKADLQNIAAVTEDDTDEYLKIATDKGVGIGYKNGYKYLVTKTDGGFMAVFLDCHKEVETITKFAIISFGSMLVCIALVYIIVVFCSRRAIDPVVKTYEKQKRFITDASHELKTPITVIATSLKVLEMDTGENKWIDKAKAQTEKLKDLVNSLVTLSRMDEEQSPLRFAKFDASAACGETAISFADFALSQGHELKISVEPDVEYVGDEYAVRQLVSILLDNAIKYATEQTPVEFSMKKSKKGITVCSKNACNGLNKEELDKLFDRFYRPDASRTSGTGGFGIGLSIARSIAEGHKGNIKAKSDDGKTVEFTAELRQTSK